jgi:hypothetical protein
MPLSSNAARLGKRAAAALLGMSLATAMASPQPLRAAPEGAVLARPGTIYIADPAAPWFESWAETNLKSADWLRRPDIRIAAGAELVAAVVADRSGIGLLTRGELSRIQTAGAPPVTIAATGASICAALSVGEARREESFGDFALIGDGVEMLATTDTLAIAEALIDAHRFKDRMTVRQVKAAFAVGELAFGRAPLAALPVLPWARHDLPEGAASLRTIGMSEAAIGALQLRGLAPRAYRTSFLQHIPFIDGVRTACDEIVLITATGAALAPDAFAAGPAPSPWMSPFTGTDLESRVREALDELKSLWHPSADIGG